MHEGEREGEREIIMGVYWWYMCAGVGHASVVTTQVYTLFCGHTNYLKGTISMWSCTLLNTDNLNHFSL